MESSVPLPSAMPRAASDTSDSSLAEGLDPPEPRRGGLGPSGEAIHPDSLAIVDTPTRPAEAGRIDLSRWEDLVRASEILGRPILRLDAKQGASEAQLYYVADGPHSYVFGRRASSVDVNRSGAYAAPVPPARVHVPPPPKAPVAAAPEPERPRTSFPLPRPPVVRPVPTAAIPPPAVPDLSSPGWEAEWSERGAETDLPSSTVVERRIREMIHELLNEFRKLPASSDELELGTEHIQRAVDMLHLGRYDLAQAELDRASKFLREAPGD